MAQFYLHIPQPCTENWQHMQPTQRGAFCSSCQQEVVDFTTMTEGQLLAYFQQDRGGSCGRFRADQLNRGYQPTPARPPLSWKRWLLAAVVSLGNSTAAWAQQRPQKPETSQQEHRPALPFIEKKAAFVLKSNSTQLKGVVVDSASGDPLPGVAIRMLGSTKGVVSDRDGTFTLEKEMLMEGEWVQFSFIGYKERILSLSDLQQANTVVLAEDVTNLTSCFIMAGGLQVVRWYTPRGIWWRIKSWFR